MFGAILLVCVVIDGAIAEGAGGRVVVQAKFGAMAPIKYVQVKHFPQYVENRFAGFYVGMCLLRKHVAVLGNWHQAIRYQRHNVMFDQVESAIKGRYMRFGYWLVGNRDAKQGLRFDRWRSSGIGQYNLNSGGLIWHKLGYIGGPCTYPCSLFKAEDSFRLFGRFFAHAQGFGAGPKRALANGKRFSANDIGPLTGINSFVGSLKLPIGNHPQEGSSDGKYEIKYNIPERQPLPNRRLGYWLLFLAYGCSIPGAWYLYDGRWVEGFIVFVIAGILAHAALSLLLFGYWWPLSYGLGFIMS